ncbi:MAG TPA: gamma-glutamyl-gamma-aminobutyrate hydrolase family protein, partial [Burkholderiaceae bacterium]|nr:gamma-glutamyl-gamma-aminobutyrate hydrolase family protein [Burkholderiaceae bacterium]
MARPLIIGISARIHHPIGPVLSLGGVYTKTLHYLEQSVAHWVLAKEVLAVMIPAIESEGLIQRSEMSLSSYAEHLDALVLQGGADIAPESYGETPLTPEWSGDRVRDRYEIDLFNAFVAAGKPVIGICRGCQLINVALGGTLFQDIPTQVDTAVAHRDVAQYERALHDVNL